MTMAHASYGPCLTLETGRLVLRDGRDNFDRDRAREPQIAGTIDLTHRSGANQGIDLVRTKPYTRLERLDMSHGDADLTRAQGGCSGVLPLGGGQAARKTRGTGAKISGSFVSSGPRRRRFKSSPPTNQPQEPPDKGLRRRRQ